MLLEAWVVQEKRETEQDYAGPPSVRGLLAHGLRYVLHPFNGNRMLESLRPRAEGSPSSEHLPCRNAPDGNRMGGMCGDVNTRPGGTLLFTEKVKKNPPTEKELFLKKLLEWNGLTEG